MLKFAIPFLLIGTAIHAQGRLAQDKWLAQDEMNLKMCGSVFYHFDNSSKVCKYCAHGLKYANNLKCIGTPDVLGKCYGDHHYHAATQECMFCALGYVFDEVSRQCVSQGANNHKTP